MDDVEGWVGLGRGRVRGVIAYAHNNTLWFDRLIFH
jgi:hypothetical protein